MIKQIPSVSLALLFYLVSYYGIVPVGAWTHQQHHYNHGSRRSFLVKGCLSSGSLIASGGLVWQSNNQAANAAADKAAFEGLLSQIQQARKQLEGVPALIDQEKWDSVRAYVYTLYIFIVTSLIVFRVLLYH